MTNFNVPKLISTLTLGLALAIPTLLPADAMAQSRRNDRRPTRTVVTKKVVQKRDNRQTQKNNWRNLGIAGGAVGVYGLLTGNKTLAALGIGGGLYSASRYEADRKSQNRDEHNRYELFRRTSFDHNGHHYVRKTKKVNGQNSYYFQRSR